MVLFKSTIWLDSLLGTIRYGRYHRYTKKGDCNFWVSTKLTDACCAYSKIFLLKKVVKNVRAIYSPHHFLEHRNNIRRRQSPKICGQKMCATIYSFSSYYHVWLRLVRTSERNDDVHSTSSRNRRRPMIRLSTYCDYILVNALFSVGPRI
jgi:hypothetical protein